MTVWAAQRVVVGKPVNQRNLRVPTKDGRHVDGFHVTDFQGGNNLEFPQHRLNIVGIFRLRGADHNILTPLAPSSTFVKHLEGFSNSGRITEENLESSTTFATFLEFNLSEQLLGGGTLGWFVRH